MLTRDEVRKWMKETKTSQYRLAAAAGIATNTVSRWLKGDNELQLSTEVAIEGVVRGNGSADVDPLLRSVANDCKDISAMLCGDLPRDIKLARFAAFIQSYGDAIDTYMAVPKQAKKR